ncbi:hypothetical protein GCM10022255_101250 [Dactylosporangium darangshiense]|uniref:Secreted protein n=1 Tax=Dactylosporangium darangshiense TaxID=579108 RepID=A0ABP8DSK7_9ACTN
MLSAAHAGVAATASAGMVAAAMVAARRMVLRALGLPNMGASHLPPQLSGAFTTSGWEASPQQRQGTDRGSLAPARA